MATFHFELVSPEKLIFTGDVDQVDVPGEEGEFGVFAGHAPYVATLKPGVLTIYGEGEPKRIVVYGGMAEMGSAGLTVLAEQAVPVAELNADMIAQSIKNAEEDITDAENDIARDKAKSRLEQLHTLSAALGR
jgi:F-type H+-transporting ATPase subunit epsilon